MIFYIYAFSTPTKTLMHVTALLPDKGERGVQFGYQDFFLHGRRTEHSTMYFYDYFFMYL